MSGGPGYDAISRICLKLKSKERKNRKKKKKKKKKKINRVSYCK